MPLESATFLPDLVVTNPAHTDGLSQADSHMRLLKSALKNTFPNFTDVALVSTQAQLDAAVAGVFPLGTAALPGLAPLGDTNTGIFSPASDQLAVSLGGTQVLLMGSTALVTSLGIAAPAVASAGSYSGGTGQLVPIGAVLEWYDETLPVEGGYCWANGQIIASANTVCPILLARWGNRFGGNGTTTMGVPDRRGSVGVGRPTMGGAGLRAGGFAPDQITNVCFGESTHTLTALELPAITSSVSVSVSGSISGSASADIYSANLGSSIATYSPNAGTATSLPVSGTFSGSGSGTANATNVGGQPHNNMQPSTSCNYILRLA